MSPHTTRAASAAKAWARALALTAPIVTHPRRTLPTVIDELARRQGDGTALLSDTEWLTFADLARESLRFARWAGHHGVGPGDAVAFVMPNSAAYFAMWLGVTRARGIAALVNANLTGRALAHSLNAARPRHVVVHADLLDRVTAVQTDLQSAPRIWTYGARGPRRHPRIEDHLDTSVDALSVETDAAGPTIQDPALYLYTSGTTGLPKAAIVSHARVMQWTHWFAGLTDAGPGDRMYDCLPMYHSAGGVLAIGGMLVCGGSVVIRERFSAQRFWSDLIGWDCTLFQYVGELCRYLLGTPRHPGEADHRLRLCCGNGLRGDIWPLFQSRFRVPHILEFYASTEGNVALANVEGVPGSIGRVPPFLAHRFAGALVRIDDATGAPLRDAEGRCVPCGANEAGEAIGRISKDSSNVASWFEGYTDADASREKILRNVFAAGDAWCRTGDLMRRDERGFFTFVDRLGDTFRWKGENVATTEVADALRRCTGIAEAVVFGVRVPGTEGRAGMAAIVADERFDPAVLRRQLSAELPAYARPMFLRVCRQLDRTSTFKYATNALAKDGYDPAAIGDALYVDDAACDAYVPLDLPRYRLIQAGHYRGTTPCIPTDIALPSFPLPSASF